MKPRIALALFAIIAVAQLAVPGSIVWQRENTLRHGHQIKVKIVPYDPSHPFMGRYAVLRFPQVTVPLGTWNPEDTGTAYAVIEKDDKGFAVIKEVHKSPPRQGLFVKVNVNHAYSGLAKSEQRLDVHYPFDRYYLREDIAPEVDRILASRRGGFSNTGQQIETWVTLRVLGKIAVLEQLWIDGVPVEEYMRNKIASNAQK